MGERGKILFQDKRKEGILDVGLSVFVQPKDGYKNLKYKSSIIGWKAPDIILIQMPVLNGVFVNLQPNCACMLRYIYKGTAYGFETKVIKNINVVPLPLLYITYPEVIEELSLRKHKRIDTTIPTQITKIVSGKDNDKITQCDIKGNILDISIGGCLITVTSNQNFDVDNQIHITFNLPQSSETMNLVCDVRRIQKASDQMLLGIQFVEMDAESKTKIQSFWETITNYSLINGN